MTQWDFRWGRFRKKHPTTRGLGGTRRGAAVWHSGSVCMVGSPDGAQWSGHPVRPAVSTG